MLKLTKFSYSLSFTDLDPQASSYINGGTIYIYISQDNIDTESMVLGDCQFLQVFGGLHG